MRSLLAILGAGVLLASMAAHAKEKLPPIPRGTQVGVVSLLDAEVMHYHAASDPKGSFVKIQAVGWSVQDMLDEALKEQMNQLGLQLLPATPTDTLVRSRESCFVDAPLEKGLPRNCAGPVLETASAAGVSYMIVLAPGLNNAEHAGSSRSDTVPESMRGWGLFTRERSKDKPTLFNEVELLFFSITPNGVSLRARQWGGVYGSQWQTYTVPADLKQIPDDQLDQLQPTYAAMLSKQAKGLLDQVHVEP
jgi:hypothetical protein